MKKYMTQLAGYLCFSDTAAQLNQQSYIALAH